MSYITNKEDIINFAISNGFRYKEKGDEINFRFCPYCNGGRHKDENTFSINGKSGAFICLRGSCGKQGHFVRLARDFGFKLDFGDGISEKSYRRLNIYYKKPKRVSLAVDYLGKRGISEETVEKYAIFDSKKDQRVICFPFYDESSRLITLKYRNTKFRKGIDKYKEWFEPETRPILFGMMQCNPTASKRLIITEGQIDALSVAESGILNAVSVPGGCSNFKWVAYCKDWIVSNFDEIVVFGDCENNQITLVKELMKTFRSRIKIVRKEDYLGEKDANDILLKYGKKAIAECIENAEAPKIPRIIPLSNVESVNIESLPKMSTGLSLLNKDINGFYYGRLILLTGKRGEGKSTLASRFVAEALDQKINTLVYSGELPNYHFKNWLDRQIAGTGEIDIPTSNTITEWYKNRAFIFDNSDTDEKMDLIRLIEDAIIRYNVRFVLVDNLMIALEDVPPESDLYRLQSKFVGSLKKLATKHNAIIVLVAHPRKSNQAFTNDDVSGSSDIANKVDIVLNYRRAATSDEFDSVLSVTKNRLTGRFAEVQLYYDESSKRIMQSRYQDKKYNWYIERVSNETPMQKVQRIMGNDFEIITGDETELPF